MDLWKTADQDPEWTQNAEVSIIYLNKNEGFKLHLLEIVYQYNNSTFWIELLKKNPLVDSLNKQNVPVLVWDQEALKLYNKKNLILYCYWLSHFHRPSDLNILSILFIFFIFVMWNPME